MDNFPRQGTTWLMADGKMGVFTVGTLGDLPELSKSFEIKSP